MNIENQLAFENSNDMNVLHNSMGDLFSGLYGVSSPFTFSQLSSLDTLFKNQRWYMLSNYRQLLSQLYVEYGIVQSLIDVPVDDAFRSGYTITTKQLSSDQIKELESSNEKDETNETIKEGIKWQRLYGGAGVIAITGQDRMQPLKELNQGDPLKFRAIDLWELFYAQQNVDDVGYQDLGDLDSVINR